uniref:C-C motif chemokine ligand 28 n=1 Tax=Rousettus aegyptiacus TaxID=9407 RepID=A0A7J8EWW0_ROUAE|nr:C-C motif chemokine ligand 28 [Rousettus aegyptiacus]
MPSTSSSYNLHSFILLFQQNLPILPIASSCCTEVSRHISRRLLERVNTCRIQRADGDCDLAAVMNPSIAQLCETLLQDKDLRSSKKEFVRCPDRLLSAFMISTEESVSAHTILSLSGG